MEIKKQKKVSSILCKLVRRVYFKYGYLEYYLETNITREQKP